MMREKGKSGWKRSRGRPVGGVVMWSYLEGGKEGRREGRNEGRKEGRKEGGVRVGKEWRSG